ncbi:hypothetical protein [Sessilibacter corallicola]|uniref:hypothetical protein n=1 Tax=Sessilibacter corallicola TaxID=2904075 RepID=UPI001E4E2154|nr:hypothetical protein [Sessilibacter corallicola]MCE2027959.1 hypothetical protein [Sessilibacter corallicola]
MKRFFLLLVLAISAAPSFAQTTRVTGLISDIWFFSNNFSTYNQAGDTALAVFYIDSPELLPACGDGPPRIAISTDHPLYDSVVSAALAAKISQKRVQMWHLPTCNIRENSWDFALFSFAD